MRTRSYSLMRPPEERQALDPLLGEVGGWVVRPRWAELAAAIEGAVRCNGPHARPGSSRRVPFAEDQHPVCDLGPGGERDLSA